MIPQRQPIVPLASSILSGPQPLLCPYLCPLLFPDILYRFHSVTRDLICRHESLLNSRGHFPHQFSAPPVCSIGFLRWWTLSELKPPAMAFSSSPAALCKTSTSDVSEDAREKALPCRCAVQLVTTVQLFTSFLLFTLHSPNLPSRSVVLNLLSWPLWVAKRPFHRDP